MSFHFVIAVICSGVEATFRSFTVVFRVKRGASGIGATTLVRTCVITGTEGTFSFTFDDTSPIFGANGL